jgi:hypothetical protein
MAATLSTTLQTVLADGVGSIAVTPIVPDGDHFVREIRVMTDDTEPVPLFILRLRATTALELDLTTPPLSF